MNYITLNEIKPFLPKRTPLMHKHQCGIVGIIAGSKTMLGAAILTAQAALRSGAGLVYLFTIPEALPLIPITYPEIIVKPLSSINGSLDDSAIPELEAYLNEFQPTVLAVGPGLGQHPNTQAFVKDLLSLFKKYPTLKAILDADALNALKETDFIPELARKFILTPHLGEFSRLFGQKPQSLNERIKAALLATQTIQQVVVLKGHDTIISSPQDYRINPTGNPGMATAGTGDVLTGMLAGFLAQDLALKPKSELFLIAQLGVYLHGKAGDLACKNKGELSLISSDNI